MIKCNRCGEVFDEDEALRIPQFVDDSGIVAFHTLACPFCLADEEDLDDYYDSGEDEE